MPKLRESFSFAPVLRHLVLWIVLLLPTLVILYWQLRASCEGNPWAFGRPKALFLVLIALVPLLFGLFDKPAKPSFWFSQVSELRQIPKGLVAKYSKAPIVLRSLAMVMFALALARPQTLLHTEASVEGIDLMFVLDLSQSMEEQDLDRNRLDAGQRTIREFLRKREGKRDRVGLVVFAKEAMLQCPLTLDYRSLDSIVADLEIGDVPQLGTAIGDALGLALASLRHGDSSSKVIILLSDGDWNKAHYMDPMEARELSVEMNVRVFTVLLGREEGAEAASSSSLQTQYAVNPMVLRELASETGGLYFNAKDNWALNHSFDEIRESLTETEAVEQGSRPGTPLFWLALWPGLAFLLAELVLRTTRFRSFP